MNVSAEKRPDGRECAKTHSKQAHRPRAFISFKQLTDQQHRNNRFCAREDTLRNAPDDQNLDTLSGGTDDG